VFEREHFNMDKKYTRSGVVSFFSAHRRQHVNGLLPAQQSDGILDVFFLGVAAYFSLPCRHHLFFLPVQAPETG